MDEWIKTVHSLGMTVAGLAITTILVYRTGRAIMDEVWHPVKDRMFHFLDKLETAFDRTRDRDRSSDSWRLKTAVRLAEIEDRLKDQGEKCDRLINHLLPSLPTATMERRQEKSDRPDAT